MLFHLVYLHLTLAHSKGQGHIHFDCKFTVSAGRYGKRYYCHKFNFKHLKNCYLKVSFVCTRWPLTTYLFSCETSAIKWSRNVGCAQQILFDLLGPIVMLFLCSNDISSGTIAEGIDFVRYIHAKIGRKSSKFCWWSATLQQNKTHFQSTSLFKQVRSRCPRYHVLFSRFMWLQVSHRSWYHCLVKHCIRNNRTDKPTIKWGYIIFIYYSEIPFSTLTISSLLTTPDAWHERLRWREKVAGQLNRTHHDHVHFVKSQPNFLHLDDAINETFIAVSWILLHVVGQIWIIHDRRIDDLVAHGKDHCSHWNRRIVRSHGTLHRVLALLIEC